ncbi:MULTISPECIES: DUF2267 domain-containing protein [Micromonospora]|uniref:DUF2267 domain-containing protein n=1 Tax=Micromonospora sicca TaxID=2202420 RepID=A0A317DPZ3_9ACTN|nr:MULTISPECIES: DUF2267 domain-containing protein [unclassified Micromonospora]MBM0229066.1 DUF2267 domain-containing protein [Micromonospora sp. ATA51]MDZ5444911.1 DUF2267 domain-containing protein [Micromonospora sp. 4G57]MDZ5487929.1 DUF2267 domain-containing protein [Micromonospora sp. 4G53]PWR16404.1 DUF2267 domain-containing protein [Micromonospora sp. 4G51]
MAELEFFEKVAARAGVPPETAQSLTEATLRTLAERISGGQAADLADHVAHELRPFVARARPEEPQTFAYDEFLRRVAARAGVADDVAERGARAVLQTLHRVVGHKEFEETMSELPAKIQALAQPVPRGA